MRILRAASELMALALCALGCRGPSTPRQFATILKSCDAAASRGDEDALARCFAERATLVVVGTGHDLLGRAAILEQLYRPLRSAVPDLAIADELVLAQGTQLVVISRITGTHARGRLAVLDGRHVVFDRSGAIVTDTHTIDLLSVAGQLRRGSPYPPRVDEASLFAPHLVAVASGSRAEREAVALVEQHERAWGEGDDGAYLDPLSDDIVFVENNTPGELRGKALIRTLTAENGEHLTSRRWRTLARFGAGEYVASVAEYGGVWQGRWRLAAETLAVYRVSGGKIVKAWHFGNSLDEAVQMGELDPIDLAADHGQD